MPESAPKLRDTDRNGPEGRGQPAGFHRVGKIPVLPGVRDGEGPVTGKRSHDDNGVVVRPALSRRPLAVAPASGPEADNRSHRGRHGHAGGAPTDVRVVPNGERVQDLALWVALHSPPPWCFY